MDGAPTLTLMDSIGTPLADPGFHHGSPAASSSAPEQLQWTLGSELEQSLLRSRGWQRQGGTYESATTLAVLQGSNRVRPGRDQGERRVRPGNVGGRRSG